MDVVTSLYSGYGEMAEQPGGRGPSQQKTTNEGKPYLDKNFPLLDSIKSAAVIFPEPVAPAAKKAPAPAPAALRQVTVLTSAGDQAAVSAGLRHGPPEAMATGWVRATRRAKATVGAISRAKPRIRTVFPGLPSPRAMNHQGEP